MSTTAASSIFRQSSSSDRAVLVTGPECERGNSEDHVNVTNDRCESVDVGENKGRHPLLQFFESKLSIISPNQSREETELEEMEERKSTVKILSPEGKREVAGGYDICREYSYSTDDDETKPATKQRNRSTKNIVSEQSSGDSAYLVSSNASLEEVVEDDVLHTHILGKRYHPIHDYASRRDDETSLFWFTYRSDFPEIKPYGIHSDAGWGCMLRSAQMLMGQALRLHFKSRSYRPSKSLSRRRQDPFLRSVLTWFADFPSTTDCVYSLHNMVASGVANYDKLPGEWYGPSTVCYVLRDLVQMHERQQAAGAVRLDRKVFRVHVAGQGTVYRDEIRKLMTRDSQAKFDEEKRKKQAKAPPAAHPLDMRWEEELVETAGKVEWDTSLLLLVPLRLGLRSFNADYLQALGHTFSLPQSVGVLGGRPRGARWFFGAVADGSEIFGLDPHTVHNAPRSRSARVNGKVKSVVDMSDDYLRSVHTTYPERFSPLHMDPSIALGFYCRTDEDLENVLMGMEKWKEEHPGLPELFPVADAVPDYSSNISSTVSDMLQSGMVGSLMEGDDEAELSDEDEYVML